MIEERKDHNASMECEVPIDVHEEGWWTNSFRTGEVLSLPLRVLLSGVYGIYTIYLCIKGIPINVQMKRRRGIIKVRME